MTLQNTTADKINSLHQEIEAALTKSLENAIEIGRLLSQAKAEIPHGQFTGWLEENCTFSGRTARRYMKLFDNRDKIGSAEGIQEAYSMLQQPKTDRLSNFEEAEFAELEAVISRNLDKAQEVAAAMDRKAELEQKMGLTEERMYSYKYIVRDTVDLLWHRYRALHDPAGVVLDYVCDPAKRTPENKIKALFMLQPMIESKADWIKRLYTPITDAEIKEMEKLDRMDKEDTPRARFLSDRYFAQYFCYLYGGTSFATREPTKFETAAEAENFELQLLKDLKRDIEAGII